MRDQALYFHIILASLAAILALWVLLEMRRRKSRLLRPLALAAAITSAVSLAPASVLYLLFYPATKSLILTGSWPWTHKILMETKEHWGLLLPVIATMGASLVYGNKLKQSRKWWILFIAVTIAIAAMGRVIKMGALR